MDTIFALSSGAPPAGIAIVRVSGPEAGAALKTLAGAVPPPRYARRARLRDGAGELLDEGLVLWFPGPGTATGEDLAEFHLHGGRAVVAAVEASLAALPGLRRAEPGEFTRRAFVHGRIDLAEAEGLADLLEAETELQRTVALTAAGGKLSRQVEAWRELLLSLSARIEAALDFADEDDVGELPTSFFADLRALGDDVGRALSRPSADRLREGFRVALAGPPNAGKSTLFNALVDSDAAIATPIPGTTRDVLERTVGIDGMPFTFVDMAGIHDAPSDLVEELGIERAKEAVELADVVLWLGPEGDGPPGSWEIEAQVDRPDHVVKAHARHRVSAVDGSGLDELVRDLRLHAACVLPLPGIVAYNRRQRNLLAGVEMALNSAWGRKDPLLIAENLRVARTILDRLVGRIVTEDVLDALFGRFCIGK